jgi:rhodanese-related sulfurtransferase
MFFRKSADALRDFTPAELHEALSRDAVTLVDVREKGEFAQAHIKGAVLCPLSCLDPASLPLDPAKPIVLQCGSGMRSRTAADKCRKAGIEVAGHLAGGISAWARAGLPVVTA